MWRMCCGVALLVLATRALAAAPAPDQAEFRSLYEELVEIDTDPGDQPVLILDLLGGGRIGAQLCAGEARTAPATPRRTYRRR